MKQRNEFECESIELKLAMIEFIANICESVPVEWIEIKTNVKK